MYMYIQNIVAAYTYFRGERERERVRETDRQTVRQREKGYKGMPSLFIPTPVRPDRLS